MKKESKISEKVNEPVKVDKMDKEDKDHNDDD